MRLKKWVGLAVMCWGAISLIDRLSWVNSDGGVQGYLGATADRPILPGCESRDIEFKATSSPAVLAYRCNLLTDGPAVIWPFQHTGESVELAAAVSKAIGGSKITQ